MSFYSLSSLLIAWVGFALTNAIALSALIVTSKHDRRHIAALLYAVGVFLSGAIPLIWARGTTNSLWERLLGTAIWGALIGGILCGIALWINAEKE